MHVKPDVVFVANGKACAAMEDHTGELISLHGALVAWATTAAVDEGGADDGCFDGWGGGRGGEDDFVDGAVGSRVWVCLVILFVR